jgi:hypothetical protein
VVNGKDEVGRMKDEKSRNRGEYVGVDPCVCPREQRNWEDDG